MDNSKVHTVLNKINSRHTFLIVDSCFSGSLFLDSKSRLASDIYDRYPSRWGLTSGRNTIVSDGKVGENSPFAKSLLEILRTNDQSLNVSKLCDYVKQSVAALTNKKQTPYGDPLSVIGHEGGQYVFIISDKEDQRKWSIATSQQTLNAFEDYILSFPNGKHIEEANKYYEMLFWTERKGSKTGCEQYLQKFSNGKFFDEALATIQQINKIESDKQVLNFFKNKLEEKKDDLDSLFKVLERVLKPSSHFRQDFVLLKSQFVLAKNNLTIPFYQHRIGSMSKAVFGNIIDYLEIDDVFPELIVSYFEELKESSILRQKILELVEQRNIEKAITEFQNNLSDLSNSNVIDIKSVLSIISSRYNKIKQDQSAGTIDINEFSVTENQLLHSLIKNAYEITEQELSVNNSYSILFISEKRRNLITNIKFLCEKRQISQALKEFKDNLIKSSSINEHISSMQKNYETALANNSKDLYWKTNQFIHSILTIAYKISDNELK